MSYCNFYRTNDRVAPHNAYTSWAGIADSVQAKIILLSIRKDIHHLLHFIHKKILLFRRQEQHVTE